MNVSEIELVNFKNIKEFKQEFEGGVYLITGENEVGKSSLIGAITMLLTGDRSGNLLKEGEAKGHAKMKVDDYTVEIRFSENNKRGTISITTEDGMTSDNKSMIQKIFNYTDFDAHEFAGWSTTADGRKKQVAIVKSLLTVDEQTSLLEIEAKTKTLVEDRVEINVKYKAQKLIVDGYDVSNDDVLKFTDEVDIQALYEKKSNVKSYNEKRDEAKTRQGIREEQLKNWVATSKAEMELRFDKEIRDVEDRLKALKNSRSIRERELAEEQKELVEKSEAAKVWLVNNEPQDVSDIEEEIMKAEHHNTRQREVLAFKAASDGLITAEANKKIADDEVLKYADLKRMIIANSKLPVEGLSFTDDGLTLNGIPFAPNEVSTSQEMEVATKLLIAKNPKVKVFKISQGESLGAAKLEAIVKFAKDNGFQGFIEQVTRGQNELRVENYEIKE